MDSLRVLFFGQILLMKKHTKSAREIKEEKVLNLTEKIQKAKTITFTNYHGLTAEQLGILRKDVKKSGGEFLVEKNSLIKLALTRNKLPAPAGQLTGPTAATFAYDDEIAPIKNIAKSNTDFNSPQFKFGFFGKDLLDDSALNQLSIIPARDTLHTNLVGSLASPIYGFVNVLSANIRNLVSVLDQASKKNIA